MSLWQGKTEDEGEERVAQAMCQNRLERNTVQYLSERFGLFRVKFHPIHCSQERKQQTQKYQRRRVFAWRELWIPPNGFPFFFSEMGSVVIIPQCGRSIGSFSSCLHLCDCCASKSMKVHQRPKCTFFSMETIKLWFVKIIIIIENFLLPCSLIWEVSQNQ